LTGAYSLHDAVAPVIAKKENLVPNDRSTQGASKLILVIGAAIAPIEIVGGIEICVAEEFKNISVNLIGTGLGDDIDLPAAIVTVLGIEVVGQNTEFRDRIQIGDGGGATIAKFLYGSAVQ
jgi:hypothetical protein